MNEVLQQNLTELSTILTEAVKSGKDIFTENAPVILEQFITMEAFNCKMWIALGYISIVCFWFCVWLIGKSKGNDIEGFCVFVCVFLIFATPLTLAFNYYDLYKINNAPELYLLQNIKQILP